MRSQVTRREVLRFIGLGSLGVALAACKPQIVKETVIVEKPVEKVVKETVQIEKQVEVEKKVEVTKVVEKVITQAPAPKAPVTIKYWCEWGSGSYADGCQAMAESAMKSNPQITVETLHGGTSSMEKLMAALASGDGPDVFTVPDEALDSWVVKKVPVPISDMVKSSTRCSEDKLVPVAWETGTRNGVIYLMPWNCFPMTGLYYSKRMLGEAGLPTDRGPKTLDELFQYTQKLTKFDAAGNLVQVGYSPNNAAGWCADSWATVFNTNYYDVNSQKFTLDTPEFIAAIEWVVSFPKFFGADKWQAFNQTYTGWIDTPKSGFVQEKQAMTLEGPWANGGLMKYNPGLMEKTGIDWHPTVDGKKVQDWATWGSVIANISKHKEEGWLLLEELGSYEGQKAFYGKVPMFLPNKQLGAEMKVQEKNPLAIWWWDAPDKQERTWSHKCPLWNEAIARINGAVEQITLGEKTDIKATMAALQAELQKDLDDMLQLMK